MPKKRTSRRARVRRNTGSKYKAMMLRAAQQAEFVAGKCRDFSMLSHPDAADEAAARSILRSVEDAVNAIYPAR